MMRFSSITRVFVLCCVALLCVSLLPSAPVSAQGGSRTYTVQPGDTLFSIATRFGVGLSELATINGVYDVNRLFVGQTLVLPAGAAVPVTPVPVVVPIYPVYPPGTTVTTITS